MRGDERLATTCVYSSLAALSTPSSTTPAVLRRGPIQHASPAPVGRLGAGTAGAVIIPRQDWCPGEGRGLVLVRDPTSQGNAMGRVAVLFVAAVAVAVLIVACDAAPRRVEVGELRTETRSVEVEGADSVRANVRIALGELDVGSGGEDRLMKADFAYNVAAWQP